MGKDPGDAMFRDDRVARRIAKKAPAKKRTVNAAFMKALTPSAALASIVGNSPLPRTEVVKQLWIYITKHKLQDAVNKRMILSLIHISEPTRPY